MFCSARNGGFCNYGNARTTVKARLVMKGRGYVTVAGEEWGKGAASVTDGVVGGGERKRW
jgi:hypothetical protein